MRASHRADAAPTVDADELAELRRTMVECEPNWPTLAGELARHLSLLAPLVAGTVQGTAAEHAMYEYTHELDEWHRAADRYYGAFDRAEKGRAARELPPE